MSINDPIGAREAAQILGLSEVALVYRRKAGKPPRFEKVAETRAGLPTDASLYVYSLAEVKALARERRRKG